MTLRKRLYAHYSGLLGDRALSVGRATLRRWSLNGRLHSGDMGGRDSTWSLLRSPKMEFFESVKLYLGDGPQMVEHSTVTLGRVYTVNYDSYHGLQLYVCMQLDKVLVI